MARPVVGWWQILLQNWISVQLNSFGFDSKKALPQRDIFFQF